MVVLVIFQHSYVHISQLVIVARREAKRDEVAEEIKSAGVAVVVGGVSKEANCKKMVDAAMEKFGGLHVAFNNAGVFKAVPFVGITVDTIEDLPDII
ncbi:short chain dehydrogenase [Ectocarpus siliculosus]|uniref:Short chain dehydrogenase n=1 Tax=Ectocarpus siliculosus TaxID=2880 RepID=D7FY97_ECTSI|nr:short chain dehydrogenase [Ectocarpus siliculosus]|eukprot:CBJ26536.1 short chain dehydrogenase [Ectocarpus siliculosus]